MSKVITFSITFPAYHPKAGQPTYFVEKLNAGLDWRKYGIAFGDETEAHFKKLGLEYSSEIAKYCSPKFHTIRAGHRFKVGDKFSPRVWSGKPYNSKQIIIAPNIEIKKVFSVSKDANLFVVNNIYFTTKQTIELAKNDGLDYLDLIDWFQLPKPFTGQIICWNENVNY